MEVYKCSYTELVPIKDLKPHPKNPNKHSKEQIERLAKIIDYQGQRLPIIVSKLSGHIVAGHGRMAAMKHLKWKKLAVDYQDFENEDQEYTFVVSDNAIAEWAQLDLAQINMELEQLGPIDIELLGLKDFVVEPIEKLEPQCDEDEVPEVKDTITKRGDVWLLGNHRVMCGDSTMIDDVEKLMKGEKADMVFTDPPYGISVVKNNHIGSGGSYAPSGKYKPIIGDNTRFDVSFIKHFFDCDLFLWGANYYCHDLEETNSWVVWQKIESSLTFSDGEMAWTSIKTPLRIYKHIWAGSMRSGKHELEMKKRVHPTQKPVTLFCEIFKDLMNDHNKIVDLFLGSGSTLIACEKTNRTCYGMELDEHYCDVIVNRWQKYTGKEATLEATGQSYNELLKARNV